MCMKTSTFNPRRICTYAKSRGPPWRALQFDSSHAEAVATLRASPIATLVCLFFARSTLNFLLQTMTATDIARRMLSAKAEKFTESVIREMTRLALKHNAVNLSQGFPGLRRARRNQRSRAPGDLRRHQSIRDHLGRESAARRDRRKIRAHAGNSRRSRARNHDLLRFDRSDDVRHDGHHQSRRRNRRVRAVLRKLRPRRDFERRDAALRENEAARERKRCVELRPGRTRRRLRTENESDHPQHAEQSDRKSFHARRTRIHPRPLRALERLLHHRRNLRAHPLRRHRAHHHGAHRRHARTHHRHQRHVQNVQRHRMARWLGHRSRQKRPPRFAKFTIFLRWARQLRCNKQARSL